MTIAIIVYIVRYSMLAISQHVLSVNIARKYSNPQKKDLSSVYSNSDEDLVARSMAIDAIKLPASPRFVAQAAPICDFFS